MRRALAVAVSAAVALAISSCSDGSGPDPGLICPEADVPLCAAEPQDIAAVGAAIEDVMLRASRGISDAGTREQFETRPQPLVESVLDGRVDDARDAAATLRAAIDAARTAGIPRDAADVAAADLALRGAEALLY